TLAEWCGVKVPATVEGQSLAPIVGGKKESVRDSAFAAYRDVQRMAKTERWKLIWYPKIDRRQLFDLASDPHETKDLSGDKDQAERVTELRELMRGWQKRVGDPLAK